MQRRNNILKKVKNYIDNELKSIKFLGNTKEDNEELKLTDEILASSEILKYDYEEALNFWWQWFSDTLQKATKFMFCE